MNYKESIQYLKRLDLEVLATLVDIARDLVAEEASRLEDQHEYQQGVLYEEFKKREAEAKGDLLINDPQSDDLPF